MWHISLMQPSGDSFIKQYSLDWLFPARGRGMSQSTQPESVSSITNEALSAFAIPITNHLRAQSGYQAKLFDVLDAITPVFTGVTIENIRAIVRSLEQIGKIRTVERDSHGNDTIELLN